MFETRCSRKYLDLVLVYWRSLGNWNFIQPI